ncbi:hypothetical protein [Paenibacillus donghaensis]|uniref:Uncharacterized protein n=1 Tax=Paenibacillus donghaensis TaxID=414771 RepID=A0A2Z2KHA4_9BACL|nr:hypothetical protein [Paenibacillus donghaensis]ASA23455.1 hypothetical protein B9T62_23195 [Paenibacillus donghaensis]
MSELTNNEDNFVGYEYKDVTVKRKMESVYIDGYNNFGWSLEGTSAPIQNVGPITMKFKRDRKIRNKVELTRLQRQFDATVAEIETLENSKVIGASTVAYIVGVLGTAFMAGSVFAITDDRLALCILLAIPGFIGWIIPYLLFCNISKKKTNKVAPLIDQKNDEVYEICEKANALLAK